MEGLGRGFAGLHGAPEEPTAHKRKTHRAKERERQGEIEKCVGGGFSYSAIVVILMSVNSGVCAVMSERGKEDEFAFLLCTCAIHITVIIGKPLSIPTVFFPSNSARLEMSLRPAKTSSYIL